MNVTAELSGVKLRPSSDLDGKLVVTCSPSRVKMASVTLRLLSNLPDGASWSRKIGEVTPNDPSGVSLSKTLGNVPSAEEAALFGRDPGKATV